MSDGIVRFEGLAESYDAYRPDYPSVVFQDLVARLPDSPRCAVDVGAGTGISTQGLIDALPSDWLVVGVEPGSDMRRVLERRFRNHPNFQANGSFAEALRLPGGSTALITACTAFHWFEAEHFFAEAARVLVPGGVLSVVRNKRVAQGAVADIDAWLGGHARTLGIHGWSTKKHEPTVRDLTALEAFGPGYSRTVRWATTVTGAALVDLYLTRAATATIVRNLGLRPVRDALEGIVDRHHGGEPFDLPWETTVKWCERR